MIRNILLGILASALMIGAPATAAADPDMSSTVIEMMSNQSAKDTAPAYAKFINTTFKIGSSTTSEIQIVSTNTELTKPNEISLPQADDLLHSKLYGSPFVLVFYMGQVAYNITHVPNLRQVDENAVQAAACYGAVAVHAFGHAIGVAHFGESVMGRIDNFLRFRQYGDELTKVALRGRTIGLRGDIVDCDGVAYRH